MLSVEVLKYIWNHPANRGRRLAQSAAPFVGN